MKSKPVPKYHIVPNFSIPPVDTGGILQLGSIIASIDSADEPINEYCHVRIPTESLFCSQQQGFTGTRSRMTSGEYGVWAKVLGAMGISGELSWAPRRFAEDAYHFQGVDTVYFNPSQAYMAESMGQSDVRDYVEGSGHEPVYMVTGLKTARGPSMRMSKERKSTMTAEIRLQQPRGLLFELGPRLRTSREMRQEMGFEDSTDFIVGIRVKKLAYKKHLVWRTPGALIAKEHNKGATMVDDDAVETGHDEVVDLGGDDVVDLDNDGESPLEVETEGDIQSTVWVVGQI